MITERDIVRNIRKIEMGYRKTTHHFYQGNFKSVFNGSGMLFKELREYSPGDDPRFIDWNVTARMQKTYYKVFEEERSLNFYILVDTSSSSLFGSSAIKRNVMMQVGADLAFSILRNRDKVSLTLFNHTIEKHIPPRNTPSHLDLLIRTLTDRQLSGGKTCIAKLLSFVNNIVLKRSVIIILSDFWDSDYQKELGQLASRHYVIGIQITDPLENRFPPAGLVQLKNPESGISRLVNTSSRSFQKNYTKQLVEMNRYLSDSFTRTGSQLLQINSNEDYLPKIQALFQ